MNVSCFSSQEIKEVAYAQIKSDIATLKKSILALEKRHNSLNNTARLPDDLLARIFMWNLSMQRNESEVPWIQVAAVCTLWRRVALDCPHLWSFIRHRRVNWITQALLPRSGVVPLHIKVTLFRRNTWEGLRKALKEMHRIRELSLTERSVAPVRMDNLLSSLIEPAPILESFKVGSTGSRSNIHHLPENLFNGFAPRLRKKLKLDNCIIPTSSPLISGITTLVLEDLSCLSPSQLLTFLQAVPNVEILKLRRACNFDLDETGVIVPPYPKVHIEIPRLIHLVIQERTIPGCIVILSSVLGPITSHLEIQSCDSDIDQVRALGNELATRISSIAQLAVRYIGGEIEILGQYEAMNRPPLNLEYHINFVYTLAPEVATVFLDALPLVNLESLYTGDH